MLLLQQRQATYDGLLGSQEFLNNMIALAAPDNSIAGARNSAQSDANKHISRLKKVLKIVEAGLIFFEANWIHTSGKNEGKVKKFQWWKPAHWKLIGKSTKFYAAMFSDIATTYQS
tara:strand:+ start:2818 stop:3165 length:348 start_codon:yes stop_codon:yes gene_type:complete